jgi:hypothetical protein
LIHRNPALLGLRDRDRAAQAVGVERTRQQPVDGDVVDHGLSRDAGNKADKPRAHNSTAWPLAVRVLAKGISNTFEAREDLDKPASKIVPHGKD